MITDYLDAHQRHWDDAELLREAQRWANADHLYGLAAECGLKRLMLVFGMTFDDEKDRPSEHGDRAHANIICERYESYRSGHSQGPDYCLPDPNPFADWKVEQRYAHRREFDGDRVQRHRTGAEAVCQLVRKARWEGIL